MAAAAMMVLTTASAGAVGFQQLAVPDPQGQTVDLYVWYPSDAPAQPHRMGPFEQTVAPEGAIAGANLPLVVISHGTGGGALTHFDTAIALAEAGFVAAAIEHTGDNWHDRALSFSRRNFTERPRHIKLVTDYLLTSWSGHAQIDPERVGAFGHSAGGATVLVVVGARPDFSGTAAFCREHPEEWACQRARQAATAVSTDSASTAVWVHDPRIKAAVIAAPAVGYTFTPAALAEATVPIQLWQAEDDRITVNRWHSDHVKANLPSPPEVHVVPHAGHLAFLAPCSPTLGAQAPDTCKDPDRFDRAAFHRDFNAAIVAFFARNLPGQ
jgi:predicted dienelactone hydrolase